MRPESFRMLRAAVTKLRESFRMLREAGKMRPGRRRMLSDGRPERDRPALGDAAPTPANGKTFLPPGGPAQV